TDRSDPPHGAQRGRGPALDQFGLSLSWELDGRGLLALLEQQRLPSWAAERGDGELLLPAFIDALQECRDAPRSERLRRLAQVAGVYVPSLYAPHYADDGRLLGVEPTEPGI
ncbi:MAG: radical SAM protein, partial [bacterium]